MGVSLGWLTDGDANRGAAAVLANAWFREKPSCCESCGGEALRYARESERPEGEEVQVNALWVCEECGHCFAAPVSRKHAIYVLLGGLFLIAIGIGTLVRVVASGAGFQTSLSKGSLRQRVHLGGRLLVAARLDPGRPGVGQSTAEEADGTRRTGVPTVRLRPARQRLRRLPRVRRGE